MPANCSSFAAERNIHDVWFLRIEACGVSSLNRNGAVRRQNDMRVTSLRHGARWLYAAMALSVGLMGYEAPAGAQTCGSDYTLKEGESLADIAARAYGSSSQWTLIFYANQDRMGANASMLVPGLSIRIPCLGGKASAGAAAPAVAVAPPV